jgi:hypothetical protein
MTLSTRPSTLTCERAAIDADVVAVRVTTDLDNEGIDLLSETLVAAIAQHRAIVVDLTETRCCDDRLLDAFRRVDAAAKVAGATLEFRHVLPPVRHALEWACLDWRIQLVGEHGA